MKTLKSLNQGRGSRKVEGGKREQNRRRVKNGGGEGDPSNEYE